MTKRKKLILISALLSLVAVLSGCQSVSYYTQAIGGQIDIFRAQRPIEKMLAEEQTPPKLKEKFKLVLELRQFAKDELNLPTNEHYVRYADLHRDNVVWNVHAAPEFSLEPKSWWYPFVGKAKYRGYFTEKAASNYAAKLKNDGFDVHFEGVAAYSTLGWFRDPLLNTFIYNSDTRLAETIFHELAHQRFFTSGDTDFNEAFATVVAEDGLRRWFETKNDPEAYKKYRARIARKDQFVQLVQDTRGKLKKLYATKPAEPLTFEQTAMMRQKKAQIIAELRENYARLKENEWGGYAGYDEWFSESLNNAQLNTVSAYYDLTPAFHALLEAKNHNLEEFYVAVEQLSKLPKAERHRELRAFLPPAEQLAVSVKK